MYGIWDNNNARFVFDVKEPTKAEAIRKFKSVAPSLWKRWRRYGRYKAKEIPDGWQNKTNWLTKINNRAKREERAKRERGQ